MQNSPDPVDARPGSKHNALIALSIFVLTLALLIQTLDHPGVTIDEPYVNRDAGKSFVAFIEVALEDIARGNWDHFTSPKVIKKYFDEDYTYHPPVARTLFGITWKLFNDSLGEIKAVRLGSALLYAISIALLFLLVSECYGIVPGLTASLGLLLTPPAFGHAHLAALDSPIASMWLITAVCFVKGLHSRAWAVGFAVAAGLTMNTKVHGFAAPVPMFLWAMFYFRKEAVANIWACVLITPFVLWLSNPLYWHAPVYEIVQFLDNMLHKGTYEKIATTFMGEKYAYSPPKYYAPFMVLITTPPMILVLASLGMLWAGKYIFKRDPDKPLGGKLDVFLLFNMMTALGLTMFKNIPIYDGVRLFLPAFSFLAGLAGTGLYQFCQRFKEGKKRFTRMTGIALVSLLLSAISIIRIHPFEMSYFNLYIGGLPGAKSLDMEPTYWNDAFTLDTVKLMNEKYKGKVFSWRNGVEVTFDYYKEIGLIDDSIVQKKKGYDYYLLQYRLGWFEPKSWYYALYMAPEHSVQREGVPLLEIYKSINLVKAERPDFRTKPTKGDWTEGQNNFYKKGTLFRWERYLIVEEAGIYQFGIWTKKPVDFFIDFEKVRRMAPRYGSLPEYRIRLDKGIHAIKLESIHGGRSARPFLIGWARPDGKKEIIPREVLLPTEDEAP